ncbi:hypothetical protein BC830DRAFT_1128864 [Chytriomyces sp. MP71]|nr:hypothetical protein BC830DRAFT_1128864 [Chytriomyces sp. MP71]
MAEKPPHRPNFRYRTLPLLTARECAYLRVLGEVLSKPQWWNKLADDAIVSKWRVEARQAMKALLKLACVDSGTPSEVDESEENGSDEEWVELDAHSEISEASHEVARVIERVSRAQISAAETPAIAAADLSASDDQESDETQLVNHVEDDAFVESAVSRLLEELHWIKDNALLCDGTVSPTSSHGVFVSDSIVSSNILRRLSELSAPIEEESFRLHKFHEGSNNQVLDLIHPSDYPLVYGITLRRSHPSHVLGDTPILYSGPTNGDVSTNFQWLPSELDISRQGRVRITSYINNLHPLHHSELYGAVSDAFEALIPMFERALGSFEDDPMVRILAEPDNNCYQGDRDEWMTDQWLKHKYGASVDLKNETLRDVYSYEGSLMEEHEAFVDELWGDDRPVSVPGFATNEFVAPGLQVPNAFSLYGRTVQVIFKMASIHLTPEKPRYTGGSWHLEGMENEAIAATGIVYYDVDNITSSRLTFRGVYNDDDGCIFGYEQSDFAGLEEVFGFANETSLNAQITGSITALQGRAVVFPNFLHHRVEPFTLSDSTKPGVRRILAFFLIHPDTKYKVLSTRDVGVQQAAWVAENLWRSCFKGVLPLEIVQRIISFTGATMEVKKAEQLAHQLTAERSKPPVGGYANVQNIFLCEH